MASSISDNTTIYMVAIMLDGVNKGDTFTTWPLHITLVPWFHIEEIITAEAALYAVARNFSKLTLTVGGEELFGANNTVPANVILPDPQLQDLHDAMMSDLQSAGAQFVSAAYTGKDFHAHVTKKLRRPLRPGLTIDVNQFCLIETSTTKDPRNRTKRVSEIINLHG